ncbi:MAG: Na+/H+ antiporter NhaC family protein [Sutterella wadsworthensis]
MPRSSRNATNSLIEGVAPGRKQVGRRRSSRSSACSSRWASARRSARCPSSPSSMFRSTAVGFSFPATNLLMTIAGALGDAGSPASDSTLGPTSGLNADGQHNHIWDTCVPTFLAYNVTLLVAGIVVSQFI